jgi:hypothetical protein
MLLAEVAKMVIARKRQARKEDSTYFPEPWRLCVFARVIISGFGKANTKISNIFG